MSINRLKLRIALVIVALAFLGSTLYVLGSWDRFVNVHDPLPFLFFAAGVLVIFLSFLALLVVLIRYVVVLAKTRSTDHEKPRAA
jgi:hypothetical protein